VSSFLTGVRETLVPPPEGRHGPLPALLVGLTVVTGLVDAYSYLVLGHVFVANMTGNVVFLGFALVGTPGFSIGASVVALVAFWFGARIGGKVGARLGQHRGHLLSTGASIQAVVVAVALLLAAVSEKPLPAGFRYPSIVCLALAMGIQNATVRKLAVPDLTTTVLTLTITGSAADSGNAGAAGLSNGRRFVSVVSILVGALVGAVFVLHVDIVLPLGTALALLVIIAVTTRLKGTDEATWIHP
jgi:uncharacterized membrane protein YoaK (UPF0700 family)